MICRYQCSYDVNLHLVGKRLLKSCKSFKRQYQKMVKHTQTIRRKLPTNCLSVFDRFVGLALKG